jgi:hypothetical protein
MRNPWTGLLTLAISLSAWEVRAGDDRPPSPAVDAGPTRLFFAPTARSLPRGEVTVGLTEVAFPWVEVGLWDRFSLQSAPLLLGDLTGTGVVVAPKIQIVRSRYLQAAIGTFQALGSGGTGGVGYAVATLGTERTAATVGYGYGYGAVADSVGSPGVLLLGAEQALGRSVRLIVEAYIGGDGLGLPEKTFMGGLRLCRGGWSFDLALVMPVYETGQGSPAPLLTIAKAF